ncbi:MAG: Cro/C1-type DNA-binding domain [Pseudomonadota bacterium]|nr:Cro/C1-type DNA-binding domain [Pseudomonadota bacterium]
MNEGLYRINQYVVNSFKEKRMFPIQKEAIVTHEELDNLRTNIFKKMVQLNIKLPQLAELIGMPHTSLWRITNEGAKPNIESLYPIADFFGVTLADLLKSPDMPQYIPLINVCEVLDFLNGSLSVKNYDTILSTEHVHENAFAISLLVEQFGMLTDNIFIFKPFHKLHEGNIGIIKIDGNYLVIKVNAILKNDQFQVTDLQNNHMQNINTLNPLAIAVKIVVHNNLL